MKYIVHRRFKSKGLCGDVNLPALTECYTVDNIIVCRDKPICFVDSENAHQYFALNDDGMGMERGKLTQAIQKTLAKRDDHYQERWDKIWDDTVCQMYKRKEYADYWLWSHEWYNADIPTLRYIAKLVGVGKI